ncbi:hypothetical protein FRB94_001139 [Tulasnella sp. JGI-2019a]|nr:hypothetical protein FRB94_001139 [Tulasnella sp. JGI-2019a]
MASRSEPGLEKSMNIILEVARDRTWWLNSNLKATEQAIEDFETIEHVMDEFGAKLRRAIIAMRWRRNDRLPISRLPAELLVNIFLLAIDGDPQSHYLRLYKLAKVSSHWNSLINMSSSLWSIIDASHSRQLQATALARSGASSLSLTDQAIRMSKSWHLWPMHSLIFIDGGPLHIPECSTRVKEFWPNS